mmetsp:Transcript_23930/g.42613  ORF Transcript_23930/g.42613 Transcript_23930/m.42613 type:complete len:152 (+) Transcript_23930:48-503(+)
MVAHSQFCFSGDHTLEAAESAIQNVYETFNDPDERSASFSATGNAAEDSDATDGAQSGRRGASAGGGDPGQHFVFLLSDANLRRYGIDPEYLGQILTSDPAVKANFIAIASLADEATRIGQAMPPGTASTCLDAADLPQLLKSILTSSIDN